jgi:uncharacterized membrane protein YphA (DoxX/SURF4 family)
MNRALWIAQWVLALLFLFAGTAKLVGPLQPMVDQTGLPGRFLLFVAVMEVLGGLGLVLPGMLHIKTALTPLAAVGLAIIMIGATTVTLQTGAILLAVLPFVTGLIAVFVAYGRWRMSPLN